MEETTPKRRYPAYGRDDILVSEEVMTIFGYTSTKSLNGCIQKGLPHYKVGTKNFFIYGSIIDWVAKQREVSNSEALAAAIDAKINAESVISKLRNSSRRKSKSNG